MVQQQQQVILRSNRKCERRNVEIRSGSQQKHIIFHVDRTFCGVHHLSEVSEEYLHHTLKSGVNV